MALLVAILKPGPAVAQNCLPLASPLTPSAGVSGCRGLPTFQLPPLSGPEATSSAGRAFLFSAVLPGTGQYVRGQRRWLAYAATEVAAWVFWRRARSRGKDFRDDFEDLAWETARTFAGDRRDGDWKYYERLTRFTRSGAFDSDGAPGIQPELDRTTFNGDAWQLARQLNFTPGTDPRPGDPDYEAALTFYRARAASTEFEWDWTGFETERLQFEGVIEESDGAFRDASLLGGAIVFNHVLSAVDAFLSSRVTNMADSRIQFRSRWEPSFGGRLAAFSWAAEWRIR